MSKPTTHQVGGDHYTKLAIQPMQYSMENGLNALQHTIIKYVTRYKDKGGIEDLRKAAHSVELLIQHELDDSHKRDGWTPEAIKQAAFKKELYGVTSQERAAAMAAAWTEGKKRMEQIGPNGNDGLAYENEWIPNNGNEPDLPYRTRVDIKMRDGETSEHGWVGLWNWKHDGDSDDITHYRIHQSE